MYFNCFETQVRPHPGGGGGMQILFKPPYRSALMGGFRGGKSQVIWVCIENKQSIFTAAININ